MAEKLVVLPEQLWKREREEEIERRKTVYPSLSNIEEDIVHLLNNHDLSAYKKVKMLSQLQQRYKGIYATREPFKVQFENVAKKTDDSQSTPVKDSISSSTDTVFAQVMNSIPKTNRTKAAQIMSAMKASGSKLDWDSQQRIIINGTTIEGSNVVDLIKNAASKSPKKLDTPGSAKFYELLDDLNVNVKKPSTPFTKKLRKKRKNESLDDEAGLPQSTVEWEEI